MYEQGLGVPQSPADAVRFYRLAVTQVLCARDEQSRRSLSEGNRRSAGTVEAVTLYRHAADQGHTLAQNNLGTMYATGDGVPEDYMQAYKWFSLSIPLGNQVATRNRARAATLLTPDQIDEVDREVRAWRPGRVNVPSITIGPMKSGVP